MSNFRFAVTLLILLFVFLAGGVLVDHWNKRQAMPTVPSGQMPAAPPVVSAPDAAPPVEESAAASRELAEKAETRMRKEFDAQAADAAAEAEAKAAVEPEGTAATAQAGATRSLAPELVSLDVARLSAEAASVIAGHAPAGTVVTLLANGQALGQAIADATGAWTITLDAPVAPGTYKLALSATAGSGAAVVREVGETKVSAPAAEAASGAPASTGTAAATPKAADPAIPAVAEGADSATAAEAPAKVVDIAVPAPAAGPVGVPPDLVASPPSTAEAADPLAGGEGVTLDKPADAAAATEPTDAAGNSTESLTDRAGEMADSATAKFSDWFNATKEQAEEAAKSFTLATAGYNANAGTAGVVTMSGRGPAKAKVQVLVDDEIVGSTEIAESGRWLIEVAKRMTAGQHVARSQILAVDGSLIAEQQATFDGPPEVVAQAQSPATQPQPETVALSLAAIDYESMGPRKGRVTIRGRAEPGASIAVVADGTRIGVATADGKGDWLHVSDTWLDVGTHSIRAERLAATGEVLAQASSEFVRPTASGEVAADVPAAPAAPATAVAAVEERVPAAKPRKRRTGVHLHKRAKSHKRASRKIASAKTKSGFRIVNVYRGKGLVRVRVRVPGRKGRVLSFRVPEGPGWVRTRRGDTLWGIADKWYGSGHSYPVIAGFNNQRVLDPDRIWPRQRLRVP